MKKTAHVSFILLCLIPSCVYTTVNKNIRERGREYEAYIVTPQDSYVYRKGNRWYISATTATLKKTYLSIESTDSFTEDGIYNVLRAGDGKTYFHEISQEQASQLMACRTLNVNSQFNEVFRGNELSDHQWIPHLNDAKRYEIQYRHSPLYDNDSVIGAQITKTVTRPAAWYCYPSSIPAFFLIDVPATLALTIIYPFATASSYANLSFY